MRPVTQQEIAYFEDVTLRYAAGHHPSFLNFEAAERAKCHENAEAFFKRFPDHPIVRGWLVAEISGAPGFFRLVAHSVNRRPDGAFVDVTPLQESDRKAYRFVAHIGSKEQFAAIRVKFPEMMFPLLDSLALSQPTAID
jgi:hypothetical protein